MKKWNNAEITELNINETENGLFCTEYECWPFINDNLKKCDQDPTTPPNDPPTDPEVVDLNS